MNSPRQTVVINQNVLATNPFSINLDILGIHFRPQKMIVRQLLYSNIVGTDNGIFLLWSNITGNNIGAIYVGIQGVALCPQSEFNLMTYSPNIDFRLYPANANFLGPTGQLTMTLEFVG